MGTKQAIRTVRLSEIKMDPFVNRKLDQNWVNKLVHDWNPAAFGVPVVAAYNGHYIWLDGQHRGAALAEMSPDDPRVDVEVHEGLTRQEMARLFVELNTDRGIRAFDKFEKLYNGGDPTAQQIVSIVQGHGLRVQLEAREGSISAVVALQRVFRWDGTGEILDATLLILNESFGPGWESFKGDLIVGVGLVLRHYPELSVRRLMKKLRESSGGASGLLGRGRTMRSIDGGTVANGVATAAVNLYNRGLRTGKLGT